MGLFKPASIEKECGKAARILKGFVAKGRIPQEVIANAKGLAIFSGFRAAMYLAGNGGSGVVVARLPDGSWSPPSAFSVAAGGIGIVYGIDVYDCICVLNTKEAVEAYTKPEAQLGVGLLLAAGPVGGTADVANVMHDVKPLWTYTKSKGIYGGLTVDGTIIRERPDANAEFYRTKATAAQILSGGVAGGKWPLGGEQLSELLKVAEGKNADKKVIEDISAEPTPGDMTH